MIRTPKTRTIDLTGKVFGKLTAVEVNKVDSGGNTHWYCVCSCGNKTSVVGSRLRNGSVQECKDCSPIHSNISDLTGKVFGHWHILTLDNQTDKEGAYWYCECSCGKVQSVLGQNMVSGKTLSCGHSPASLKHGMTNTKFYNAWAALKARCLNEDHPMYFHYGGRGIDFDPSWEQFENFYNDMYPTHHEDLELDRIDNDKGYSKENCRWTTRSNNAFNTRKRRDNKTGKTGVSILSNGEYHAEITCKTVKIKLGRFSSFSEACEAREQAEILYFGQVKK